MAIIVGDIHGNVEKVRAFLAYKPNDLHVGLGDYLDSFHESPERQLESLQLLLDSDVILLWGNHDLHYLDSPLFQFPGYNLEWAEQFRQVLEKNIDRFIPSYLVDGWLCTHAGVNSALAKNYSAEALESIFNNSWRRYLCDRSQGYLFKSIFTFDFMIAGGLIPDSIKQIHGHDECSEAGFTNSSCVSIGCNDKGTAWIFDTEANEVKNIWI